MHPYFRMFACALLAELSLLVPVARSTSAAPAPPAACQQGDTVHTISPGTYSIEPRPGFSPLNAPDGLLSCYGFPERPKDAEGLSRWNEHLGHAHRYVAPVISDIPASPVGGGLVGSWPAYNWTGYETLYGNNGNDYYYEAEGQYTVPTIASNVGYHQTVAEWVGLGGDGIHYPSSTVLWQSGTYSVTGSPASYNFFYEDWGCSPSAPPCPNGGYPVVLATPTVGAGQSVYVKANASNGTVYFQNNSTGQYTTLVVSINNNNTGLSAEWIVEEAGCPTGCTYTGWTDPGWSSAYAYGTTLSTYFNIMNYQRIDLTNGRKVIAQPQPPNANHGYNESCCAF